MAPKADSSDVEAVLMIFLAVVERQICERGLYSSVLGVVGLVRWWLKVLGGGIKGRGRVTKQAVAVAVVVVVMGREDRGGDLGLGKDSRGRRLQAVGLLLLGGY